MSRKTQVSRLHKEVYSRELLSTYLIRPSDPRKSRFCKHHPVFVLEHTSIFPLPRHILFFFESRLRTYRLGNHQYVLRLGAFISMFCSSVMSTYP